MHGGIAKNICCKRLISCGAAKPRFVPPALNKARTPSLQRFLRSERLLGALCGLTAALDARKCRPTVKHDREVVAIVSPRSSQAGTRAAFVPGCRINRPS